MAPSRPWVELAEGAEYLAAQAERQAPNAFFFHQVQLVAAIAAEAFIAAIAGKGDGDVFAGQLADAVGGDSRAVGVGFVVEPGRGVDEVEVVAFDHIEVVIGVVAVGHHFGEFGFVESLGSEKPIEQVLTGLAERPAIMATTALESTPPERNAPSGTSEIMRRRMDSSRRWSVRRRRRRR